MLGAKFLNGRQEFRRILSRLGESARRQDVRSPSERSATPCPGSLECQTIQIGQFLIVHSNYLTSSDRLSQCKKLAAGLNNSML